jgi:hypothetical protein
MSIIVTVPLGSRKNYTEDWSKDVGADTIASAVFAFNLPGLTIVSQSNTTTGTTVVIEAPQDNSLLGKFFDLSCLVTTASGLKLPKTFTVEIVDREYLQ